MNISKDKLKDLAIIVLAVALVAILLNLTLPYLNSEKLVNFVKKFGVWGPLTLILFLAITQIIAPLPGSPGIVVSLAIYGWEKTRVFAYLGSLISAVVSFWIAKKWGRRWVIRLVGKKAMRDVDEFAQVEGTKVLIISRILGFPLFDYVSYAAGFTKISFKVFFISTV